MDHASLRVEHLLAELRAAGVEVSPGDNPGELRVVADEAAFALHHDAIRANKAAILENFGRQASGLPSFCVRAACRWHEACRSMCSWRSPDGRNWVNMRTSGLRACPARADPT